MIFPAGKAIAMPRTIVFGACANYGLFVHLAGLPFCVMKKPHRSGAVSSILPKIILPLVWLRQRAFAASRAFFRSAAAWDA